MLSDVISRQSMDDQQILNSHWSQNWIPNIAEQLGDSIAFDQNTM